MNTAVDQAAVRRRLELANKHVGVRRVEYAGRACGQRDGRDARQAKILLEQFETALSQIARA